MILLLMVECQLVVQASAIGLEAVSRFPGLGSSTPFVHTVGSQAWIANSNHFQLVDITDAHGPTVVGTYTNLTSPRSLQIRGTVGYFGGEFLDVVNLSDPAHPHLTQRFGDLGYVSRLTIVGEVLYCYLYDDSLVLLDVSLPAMPTLLRKFEHFSSMLPNFTPHWGANLRYRTSPSESSVVDIWDLSDPSNPIQAGSISLLDANLQGGLYGPVVVFASDGDRLFVASGTLLRLYSLRDPEHPSLLSSQTMEGFVESMGVQNGHLIALTAWGNLLLYSIDGGAQLHFEASLFTSRSDSVILGAQQVAFSDAAILVATTTFPLLIACTNTESSVRITQQPPSSPILVDRGDPVSFSISASSAGTIHYQWYHDNMPVASQTNESFRVEHADRVHAGEYWAVVATSGGSMVTEAARIGINVPMKLLTPVLRADGLIEIPFLGSDGETPSHNEVVLMTLQDTEDPTLGAWRSSPLWPLGIGAGPWYENGYWRVVVPQSLWETPSVPWLPPAKSKTNRFFRLQNSVLLPSGQFFR